MKNILPTLLRWQRTGETVAVATLVHACGSVPRQPGARLGMTRSGHMIGSVSGGCVENDVFEHALQVLDSGVPMLARYNAADPGGVEVGLSCGGSIDVLIEPFAATEGWQALCAAIELGRPIALAVALTPPALAGRTRVVLGDGTGSGSVDSALDAPVAAAAQRLTSTGGTTVLEFPWHEETASVFIEAFPAPRRLFIVGGTHTAVPLCRLAKVLGFHITVVDPRTAWATAERFPEVDLLHAWPAEVLEDACTASPAATAVV